MSGATATSSPRPTWGGLAGRVAELREALPVGVRMQVFELTYWNGERLFPALPNFLAYVLRAYLAGRVVL